MKRFFMQDISCKVRTIRWLNVRLFYFMRIVTHEKGGERVQRFIESPMASL